jgi:heme A synthase
MGTLSAILDFVVLLFLVVTILRRLGKNLGGTGSLVLSVCLAIVLLIFGIVSFSAYLNLFEASSSLTRVIFLVVLLGMGGSLLVLSRTDKPAA